MDVPIELKANTTMIKVWRDIDEMDRAVRLFRVSCHSHAYENKSCLLLSDSSSQVLYLSVNHLDAC